MGVQEKMVHSRIFTEMSLEFIVDRDYKIIKFFEFWMDYITNGSETGNVRKSDAGYFYRMRYPRDRDNGYKCDKIKIIKFEPSQGKELEYTFYGAFPINFSSTPVQYGSSDVLRANVTFNYERYIAGKEKSIDVARQEQVESVVDDYGRTPEEARRIVDGGNEVLIGF